jgi:hypothetical protein
MKGDISFDFNQVLLDYLPYLALDIPFLKGLIMLAIQISVAGRLLIAGLLDSFLDLSISPRFLISFARERFCSLITLLACFLVTKPFFRN